MMEKLHQERGAAAFERATFTVEKWSGPVPADRRGDRVSPGASLSALHQGTEASRRRDSRKIYLDRLKRLDPTLLCAVTIMEEQALAEAARADAEIKAGKYRGPLHGIP